MGKTKNASKALTQEEIWDDSALVQSWDEAVEEYKLYHSIHAKGENVDDVLREAEDAEQAARGDNVQVDAMEEGEDGEEGAEAEGQCVEAAQTTEGPAAASNPPPAGGNQQQQQSAPTATAATAPATATPMPHPLLSQVQDEGLKNLMMSWYYAGYYTGLYEGQQRANKTDNP
ncbi:hypothetical protein P168DRAFT_306144 [Aspergillus campestris IBT 28561]|uniref:Survival Motor Neuron Gemin2-binding domain-containing protein n=1 Tax=Aspergillus campestris (strain IBT 28561) TaxID=1392248 RepID=A0A2I1CW95_ASPC2|nr:uncharacterized protein P168DRAFT_306144 [Aspergillus campestris IBT 28561]PKY01896.1 hypothetical protein P168DRAFT_306144 [Aspergillus campestris IBT 28561]